MIDPAKDVDGLTPTNAGLLALGSAGLRPCTPLGVMELLAEYEVEMDGAEAVVLGRSNLFGKPMAALLREAERDGDRLPFAHALARRGVPRADILVAATGRPRMVKRDWVKEGAVVIDGGITRLDPAEAGNRSGLVGDVDFEAAPRSPPRSRRCREASGR